MLPTFAKFPDLWTAAISRIAAYKQEIFQTLGINPAMIAQDTGVPGKKRNQAEVANEQQVDILMTADAVTVLEEGILTPLLYRFAAYDHQFRDREVTVKQFGEMGLKANMQDIPLIQLNNRYEYRWYGVEAARNAQQIQQQIAMANVIKGIPPAMYQGYRLNLAPLIVQLAENSFGPRLAPLVFESIKDQLSVSPQIENQLLSQGFDAEVHPLDDDPMHIQAHLMAAGDGDFHGTFRTHILKHQMQMQQKAQAMQPQQPKGLPGGPGNPGVAGTPKPGGQVQGPRLVKGPPGTIPPESMPAAGAVNAPRKF